jgi:hypothetical protein
MKKKSLIPETTTIVEVDSYEAIPTGIVVKEFYDPDFQTEGSKGTKLLESNPRYKGKTVTQLKDICREFDIPVSGTRKQLIKRISDKVADESAEVRKKASEKKKERQIGVDEKTKTINSILQTRLKKLTVQKETASKQLFKAQQKFDSVEAEYNEVKITLKSLESLF